MILALFAAPSPRKVSSPERSSSSSDVSARGATCANASCSLRVASRTARADGGATAAAAAEWESGDGTVGGDKPAGDGANRCDGGSVAMAEAAGEVTDTLPATA